MKFTKQKTFSQDRPFIYTSRSVSTINLSFLLLLLPQLLLLFIEHDLYAILNIFSAITATLCCQSIVYYMEKTTFKVPLEALLQGLFIGFFMPTNIGFLFVFVCSFVGFSITRIVFGKAGRWVHSTMFVLLIAYISHPELFLFFHSLPNTSENASVLSPFDSSITSFLNAYLLNNLGISLPEGYLSLFWSSTSLIPACRYNLLTILASIIFLSLKIYDYIIPIVFIFVYATLVYCIPTSKEPSFFRGDVMLSLMSGGLLFSVFFLLPEPHSFPKTKASKLLSGFFLAIVSFLISAEKLSFIGLSFASLLLNVISPYIEEIEQNVKLKRAKSFEGMSL